ncbi:MAG TPA: TIM barrel protein, partial [Gemmataceae bacterium]|nr:TIM barrel protein [Gemmataceae bacterium]
MTHTQPSRLGRQGRIGLAIASIGAGVLLLLQSPASGHRADHQRINIGLQLYSLRAQLAKDVPDSLALVEKWGITDVETAGFYGMTARQFRQELDRHHLHASGGHFGWERFAGNINDVIRDAKTLGCEYVTIPWVPHGSQFTEKDARMAIKNFNAWGRKCADAGLKFTYHAHGYEFRPYKEGTLFDLIAHETNPQFVNFELDIFWASHGGADPVKLMQKYPTRFLQMHLKDMRKGVKTGKYTGHEDVRNDVVFGTGQLDLPAILAEAERIGIKHYYIEDES